MCKSAISANEVSTDHSSNTTDLSSAAEAEIKKLPPIEAEAVENDSCLISINGHPAFKWRGLMLEQ